MKTARSTDYPRVQRSNGMIIVPVNIQQVDITDDHTGATRQEYEYELLCVEDTGQEAGDDFALSVQRDRIKAELAELDHKTTRALRAIATGESSTSDNESLAVLEQQAQALRQELAELE